ncbi:MAG: hypothetical protein IPK65_11930 [Gammaproteobacteria bacterium]|nr:hypothetical protein [Gammaproteobacteria bacterium]
MTSPTITPAFCAGLSGARATNADRADMPKDSARARSNILDQSARPTARDMPPRCATGPTTLIAISIGITNDDPMNTPVRLKICELTPTTSPSKG